MKSATLINITAFNLLFQDVDLETFKSSLSEDGFLTVRANILEPEKPPEKTIEIDIEKSKS